jgi:ABC-2 type transport system permease protein
MTGIWIIMKRELYSLLVSPVTYVVLGLMAFFFGYQFISTLLTFDQHLMAAETQARFSQNPDILSRINLNEMVILGLTGFTFFLFFLASPILTMRFFSEEKAQSTYELLLTSPISLWEIILGKLAAAKVFLVLVLATHLIFLGVMFFFGNPEWGPVLSAYLGLFLSGLTFFAIGMFASSLSRSALVSVFIAFGLNLGVMMIAMFAPYAPPNLGLVLKAVSIHAHFGEFNQGVIQVSSLVYFFTMIALFLGATHISLRSLSRT